uniref:Uncharacterized protein n=1 Tax=Anguilla anguilla TaxID=7936 RepID=A0A0E9SJW1_ANGAN
MPVECSSLQSNLTLWRCCLDTESLDCDLG